MYGEEVEGEEEEGEEEEGEEEEGEEEEGEEEEGEEEEQVYLCGLTEQEIFEWFNGMNELLPEYNPGGFLTYNIYENIARIDNLQAMYTRKANLNRFISTINPNEEDVFFLFTIPIYPTVYIFSYNKLNSLVGQERDEHFDYFYDLYDKNKSKRYVHCHLYIERETINEFMVYYNQGNRWYPTRFLVNLERNSEFVYNNVENIIQLYQSKNKLITNDSSQIDYTKCITVYFLSSPEGLNSYTCHLYEKKSFLNVLKKNRIKNECYGNTIFVSDNNVERFDPVLKIVYTLTGKTDANLIRDIGFLINKRNKPNTIVLYPFQQAHFNKYSLFYSLKNTSFTPQIITEIIKYL
jgi:hypothetical protein